MIQKGIPEDNSYICLPSKEDLDNYNILVKENRKINHIHEE